MLNASIVLYKHQFQEVHSLIETLRKSPAVSNIYLIDNSPQPSQQFSETEASYLFTGKNLGYGAGHNIAIRKSIEHAVPYHLVINPDISFDASILLTIEAFMDANPGIGQLMPKVLYPDGRLQYLCKLLPTPFDLMFRRFLPQSWTKTRMEKFELRNSGYQKIMDVPYLSGCFMFLRTEALKQVGLFDERFFMYPEDIDLTRRIHQSFRTVFYPEVSIVHHHEQSSYRSLNMLMIHAYNLIKYFNKWGWVFDPERKKINKTTLIQLKM